MMVRRTPAFAVVAVLATLLLVLGGTWSLWRNGHLDKEVSATATPQKRVEPPKTTIPKKSVQPAEKSPPKKAPFRHEDVLAVQKAVAEYPQSFTAAVERGDLDFATSVVEARYQQVPQSDPQAEYDFLAPLMRENRFLWRSRTLSGIYWSMVAMHGGDLKPLRVMMQEENPEEYNRHGECLEAWAIFLPLAGDFSKPAPQAATTEIERHFDRCLAADHAPDDGTIGQLQFYLAFIRKTVGKDAAYALASTWISRYPGLPAVDQLVPEGKKAP